MDESGQDTDIEVLRSDQVTEIGVPIAKSPADLRKLMESVQKKAEEEKQLNAKEEVKAQETAQTRVIPASPPRSPAAR